jgi:creatinine deaminase
LRIGEHQTFPGEEERLRQRGVSVEVRNDSACIRLMSRFVEIHPELWREDIGV